MELERRGIVAQEIKGMLARGASHGEIAVYLRETDCDIREAIPLMAAACGIRMSQAKSVIFRSPSWSEEGKRIGEFHDQVDDP